MTIYRGPGGGGNADSDAEINQLAAFALDAENSAIAAAASAVQAAESADASAAAVDASIAAGVSAADALSSANDAADSAILAVDAKDAAEAAQLAAESSATAAASSVTDAVEAAALAFSSENAADTAAENAAASAVSAASSASTATTQAGLASTSASNAATSASGASTSASNAASSASSAAASYDSFDDRYLGAKSSNPTLDNDGNALLTGALYWNTAANEMRVYSGSAWIVSYLPADGYVQKSGDTMTGALIISNVDVLNASYDSVSFSVAAQEAIPTAVFFSADGSKMFVTGTNGDDVNEYVLSTPWVVSSATYSTVFSIAAQEALPQGIFFRADGLKMYVVGTTNDTVYQYALTSPWSVATASYESISFSVAAQDITPSGVFFKPNGLSMYVCGTTGDSVYQYTLSTAWDVSTSTYLQTFSISAQESAPQDLSFTGDGTRMFVIGSIGDDVNVYNLTTPWDISTATFIGAFSVAAEDVAPVGLFIKPDGTKMYVVGQTNDTVYQYSVPSVEIQLTGTTAINGGATVAQDLTVNGNINGPTTLVANSTATALRITQTGTGNAFVVEDSTNPDSTPFVIDASGNVTVGGSSAPSLTVSRASSINAVIALTNTAGSMFIGNSDGNTFAVDSDANLTLNPLFAVTNEGATQIAASSTSNALRITQTGTGNALLVEDSTNPDSTPFVVDASGYVVAGYTTSSPATLPNTKLVQSHAAAGGAGYTATRWDATANGPQVILGKSRGGAVGTLGIVADGDVLGQILFTGDDGTDLVTSGATITASVDGTPGTNDMPGRLVFSTTADGASTPTERMRITNAGNVGIGTAAPLTALNVNGTGGELLRLSVTSDSGVIQEPAIGFATGVTNTHPAAKISALEDSASNARASLLFYTRDSSSDVAPTERMRIDSSGNLKFDSGYGSVATAYGCRAWVNFNGTGTVAIRGSGNISSITDNGTGDYTLNFSTAMPDANYNLVGATQQGAAYIVVGIDAPSGGGTATLYTTTQVRIQCYSTGTADPAIVGISIFR